MISHLLVLASLGVIVALLAGASARLPRLRHVQPKSSSEDRPLPAEIRRAVEAGMAGLSLQRSGPAGTAEATLASQPIYLAAHHPAAAIRPHIGNETATATAIPNAGRKSNGSSSVAANGS